MKRLLSFALIGTGLLASAGAFAHEGYVTANVNLRAGPDRGYPAVVRLHAGTPVEIEGCVDGWSWCDVSLGYDRGWVPGAYLQEEYDGRRVLIRDYGVRIGVPIVSFAFGDYWDSNYRSRSWYGNRDRWSHVQPSYYSGGSYGYGGSYDGHSGSYGGHSGSYGQSSGSYSGTRDTYRTESRDAYVPHSSGYRSSGGSRGTTVTTHSTYRDSGVAQPTYRTDRTYTSTPRRVESTVQQTYSTSAPVHNPNPQRSASGEQHSMAGRQRAAEVHARNAERHADRASRGQEKSDANRGRKGKDKRNDDDQGR